MDKEKALIDRWFATSIPDGDYYYHWGLFNDWQGDVNDYWYNLDIYERIARFSEFDKNIASPFDFWCLCGKALVKLGRVEEAIASYDQALKINPDDTEVQQSRELVSLRLMSDTVCDS